MKASDFQDELVNCIAGLDEKAALALVKERLKTGYDPFRIIESCKEGVRQVGLRYEKGSYFLAGLIMAGVILRSVIDMLQPELTRCSGNSPQETIVIGTVRGDIHDIGKNIGGIVLNCEGFNVIDLGVDIREEAFVDAIKAHRPKILGLSCLLTTAFDSLKSTTDALEKAGLRNAVSVLIAGSLVDEAVCKYVKADHWTNDAINGLQWCKRIVQRNS